MPRSLRIGLLVALLLFVVGGTWWLLRPERPYPRTQSVESLADTVAVRWTPEGLATIDASDPTDALAALGYVHGVTRGWTVTLWRQTARGRLSRWFGTGVLPLDRHTRRLALARQARTAYKQLSPPQKERLRAYARGLTAALRSPHVQHSDPFVLHDVTPAPWEPWHTLAVERLLAWLATVPIDPPSDAPAGVSTFHQADQQLRRWLHLHGWERSVAWAVRSPSGDSAQPTLFQRHVLGASATPILQEVRVASPNGPSTTGASLPGTPILPTGTRGKTAWASLLRSPARLQQTAFDSTTIHAWYERLEPSDGDERLLRVRRLDGALLLGSVAGPPQDTTAPSFQRPDTVRAGSTPQAWVLRWPGFSAASDLPAWLERAGLASPHEDTTAFDLVAADGLHISPDGWSVLGSPPVVARDSTNRHVLVGQSSWAHHQAHSLRAHQQGNTPSAVTRWSASDSSTWAARTLPGLSPALDRLASTHPQFRNVVTYLRNWDYVYDASSIGATLFDQWMRASRTDLGRVPAPSDTAAYFGTYRQHRALLRALDTLRSRFGPDVRRWRWERATPDRRFFPVWSADSLVSADLQDLRTTRYAPLERSGRGHPSTLAGGPSLVAPDPTAPSPTTWDGWITPPDRSLTVRRHHYDPDAVFARSRMQQTRPSPIRLSPDNVQHTTLLLPSSP